VRRTDARDAQYAALRGVDPGCCVDELKVRWASDKTHTTDADLVVLRLVKRGPGKPDAQEEGTALLPEALLDDPRLALAEAGITDGSSLLAVVTPLLRSSGSPGARARPSLLAAPTHLWGLTRSPLLQIRTAQAAARPSSVVRRPAVWRRASSVPHVARADDAYTLLQPFLSAPLDENKRRAFATERAFQSQRKLLKSGLFSHKDVARLLIGLQNFVCTTTRHLLVSDTGLVLDGPVPGSSTGQGSASVRFALLGSAVFAVKVGHPRLVDAEFAVSEAVAAAGVFPTVMRILRKVALPQAEGGAERAALLMPVYAMSLSDAALALPPGPSAARDVLALNAALCGAAAVAAFAAAGYAHGDIKPGNLMLDGSGLVAAIDFGTAQRVGTPFREGSGFGLDALGVAGAPFDLTCLGATLWSLQHASPLPPHCTRASLAHALAAARAGASASRPPAAAVAAYCLSDAAESQPLASLRQLLLELLAADAGAGATWHERADVVDLDRVWPKPAL